MAHKEQLRTQRTNTVINSVSKREDKQCLAVVSSLIPILEKEFGVTLEWEKKLTLKDSINKLRKVFPDVDFSDPAKDVSFMSPDGGITYLISHSGMRFPILIAEVKNQGTNDVRLAEGRKKQPQGNAIERLGKNVIGFRAFTVDESIFPFVCFGDGCDFAEGSSILDRVLTIAMFGQLNVDHTENEGPNGIFNRGSFYFRQEPWTAEEMKKRLLIAARKSIKYYFDKYGESFFK